MPTGSIFSIFLFPPDQFVANNLLLMFRRVFPMTHAPLSFPPNDQLFAPTHQHLAQGQLPNSHSHNGNERSRRTAAKRQSSIAWLNEQWSGPGWLPADVRAGLSSVGIQEPSDKVVSCLQRITELLNLRGSDLHTAWQTDGALRVAVDKDLERRIKKLREGAPPPRPHLTGATARAVLKGLQTEGQDTFNADDQSRADLNDYLPEYADSFVSLPASPISSHDDFHDAPSRPTSPPPHTISELPVTITEHKTAAKKRTHDEFADMTAQDEENEDPLANLTRED
ncbi:hypothetical protein CEP54_015442 [Fusarium duplospermum]|uniref:Uncharacterized protein n=1 Tax=Fusarium duplospermum TaxID=1325734 RepID=A0A428NP43_9HYPO|nr:hypothetical protein CEP54_015442 [Fusarium duplospermum]